MRWLPLLALCLLATRADAAPCGPGAAPQAAMCKCGDLGIDGTFTESNAVFSGVVVRVERPTPISAQGDSVTLVVRRAWKGTAAGDTMVVVDWPVCGVLFRPDSAFLVYARADENGALRPHGCLRSRQLTPPGETRRLIPGYTWEDMAVLDSLVRARRP
jgi:hypothetical protein